MEIEKLEFIPVSVPYTHREVSSLVNRDGVTDVIVKATTDDGLMAGERAAAEQMSDLCSGLCMPWLPL